MIKIELQFTTVAEAVAFLAAGNAAIGYAPGTGVLPAPEVKVAETVPAAASPSDEEDPEEVAKRTKREAVANARKLPPGVTRDRSVINPGADPHVGEFYDDCYIVDGEEFFFGDDEPKAFAKACAVAKVLYPKPQASTPAPAPVEQPVATPPTAEVAQVAAPETKEQPSDKPLDYATDVGPKVAKAAAKSRADVVATLTEFGVTNAKLLDPAKWPAFVARMDAILAA